MSDIKGPTPLTMTEDPVIDRRSIAGSEGANRPSWIGSLARFWPWIIWGIAIVFFSAWYIPGFYFSAIDTETVVLPVFYHDIVDLHHPVSNWGWGGFSALFPDVIALFFLNFICHNDQLALELMLVFFFLGWLMASVSLAVVLKRPNKLSLSSILLLLWVGLMCNFALPLNWGLYLQNSLFEPVYHSGTGLLSLICLVLLLGQVSGGRTAGFWWLFVLVFLGGISDILFLIVFAVPALAAVGLLAVAFRRNWKRYLGLALNLTIAGAAAYFLGSHCFPVPLATDAFVQLGFDRASGSFSILVGELLAPEHHLYAFLVALDVLTVAGGIAGLLFFCFSSKRKQVSAPVFSLLVFCSSAISANWIAVIFTGDYQGITANRYLTVALLVPLFLLVFGLHAIIHWRPWLEKLFVIGTSAFTGAVAFIPQTPSINYDTAEMDIPFLETVMKDNHIQAGLADYWSANIITFLSHGAVPLRSLSNDGTIYRWFNSLEWFGKGHSSGDWPRFRMIYCPDPLDREAFGQPDQILQTPSKSEVWLYSDARSIRYSEYFDVLSTTLLDDGRTLRINASALPGEVGKIQDRSRIAVMGQDGEGWLDYGPYLSLVPARYRVTFRYTYLAPPVAGQFPVYDLLMHTGNHEQSFHSTALPCPNTGPQIFTDDFTVSERNHQYEMRIYYHGSGTLRVDSLDVTYGPNPKP